MTLNDLFDLTFVSRRDVPALEWQGRTFTFGEIDRRANQMAHALAARGFVKADRLCLQITNCIEFIDIFLACVRLGVIFVPVNVLYKDREISHIVNDADPREFFTDLSELVSAAQTMPDHRPVSSLDGDTPAALVYTSGTTGASKGAVLTHNNFAANAVNLVSCWQITPADRFLLALPLFHVHALGNGLHCWLLSGCRMRLLERFEHQKAAAEFLDFQPTLFFGVPTIYVRLLDTDLDTAQIIGKHMRLFVSGSAPLPPQTLEDFRARFGYTILERYGMSETLMNTGNPYVGERRAGTVGMPFPGVSTRIVNGELWVKGPNVFSGYWRREDATRDAFEDGWFKTGDIASMSEDGYITLRGRRSDLIISGGFNIYPREIEEFLMEQPEVAEAAIAGRPDAVRGEVPVAFIVSRSPIDAAALEQRCRDNFASFKIPRSFVTVERLPRNTLGKVQKHLLPV